jgi:hypothetical protein
MKENVENPIASEETLVLLSDGLQRLRRNEGFVYSPTDVEKTLPSFWLFTTR